jgi:hypothetical protein
VKAVAEESEDGSMVVAEVLADEGAKAAPTEVAVVKVAPVV